jgi:hypothetical protein
MLHVQYIVRIGASKEPDVLLLENPYIGASSKKNTVPPPPVLDGHFMRNGRRFFFIHREKNDDCATQQPSLMTCEPSAALGRFNSARPASSTSLQSTFSINIQKY